MPRPKRGTTTTSTATSTNTPRPKKRDLIQNAATTTGNTQKPRPKRDPPRPVTARDRARVRELLDQGLPRNEIARKMRRSAGWVTKQAQAHGTQFDQSTTVEATAARVQRMRDRRLDIAEQLLDDAAKLRDRLWTEHTYYERGPDKLIPVTLPLPPLRDVRDGYGAMSLALKGHHDLMRESSSHTVDNQRSVMTDLLAGIRLAAEMDGFVPADAVADPGVHDETEFTASQDRQGLEIPGETL